MSRAPGHTSGRTAGPRPFARIARAALALAVALGPAACASPAPKRGWDDVGVTAAGAPEPAATGDLALPEDEGPAPAPGEYPPPPGGRLLAGFSGPSAVASPADLVVPAALARALLPDGPPVEDDLPAAGLLDLDVDGDGVAERVILARPDGPIAAAVLVALRRDGAVAGGWSLAAVKDGARTCHGEWTLAGSVARGRARLPVVFEERGVGCAALEGGGFDRRLLVFAPGSAVPLEALLGRARLGAGGAADVHEAVAYAADRDGDGVEELWVRGISRGLRPCGRAGDPPYWIEERAWRVSGSAGTVAVRGREVVPLPDGVLPPTLLESHPAPCGAAPRIDQR